MFAPLCLSLALVCSSKPIKTDDYKSFFDGIKDKRGYLRSPKNGSKCEQYLGLVSLDTFDSKSLANTFGDYGSTFSSTSIMNTFSDFGSDFGSRSPWNTFSSIAVEICDESGCVEGYLSTNSFFQGKVGLPIINPKCLVSWLGRTR